MNKQAWVGAFTLLGIIAVFAVFFVLSDFSVRSRGYQIGVRFRSASGLQRGAQVALSGVPIGVVDRISLLSDYTTDVVMSILPGYDVPLGSRFIIQAPITGEPSVLIEPPRGTSASAATLPHEVADLAQQPEGSNPTTFSDLLEQGQGEAKRLDDILAELQKNEPLLLAELRSALNNANELTTTANHSLTTVTGQVQVLADSLQRNLTAASNNVVDLTGHLDAVVKRNSSGVDELLAQLNRTSRSFGVTVDALRGIATTPSVKTDLLATTRDFALTAKTFADLTQDLRRVTSNEQTQAQLRDTVAQLDATSQKVDSLVGSLGGTSSVYGVDRNATPAPESSAIPAANPLAATSGSTSTRAQTPASGSPIIPTASPASLPNSYGVPGGMSNAGPAPVTTVSRGAPPNAKIAVLRERLNRFTKDLVQLEVRVSALAPLRPGSYNRNVSPLLTSDRGLQSDFNLFVLPKARTGLELGANDLGTTAGTTTANALLINRSTHFSYGGGVEYSRLGVMASLAGPNVGLETRAYDLRHPTIDQYLNVFALPKAQVFLGERDLLHASRRSVLGLQFEF